MCSRDKLSKESLNTRKSKFRAITAHRPKQRKKNDGENGEILHTSTVLQARGYNHYFKHYPLVLLHTYLKSVSAFLSISSFVTCFYNNNNNKYIAKVAVEKEKRRKQ